LHELLDAQWDRIRLPVDPKELQALAGATETEWTVAWPKCEPLFPTDNGARMNLALKEQRQIAVKKRDEAIAKSVHANDIKQKKRQKHSQKHEDLQGDLVGDLVGDLERTLKVSPSSSSSSSSSSSTSKAAKTPSADALSIAWQDPQFIEFKRKYPERSGRQPWPGAAREWLLRIKQGHTADEILAGLTRYTIWLRATGGEGTQHVLSAVRFLEPEEKLFAQPWNLPASKAGNRLAANVEAGKEFMRRTDNGK
jgi:hypothetical protein